MPRFLLQVKELGKAPRVLPIAGPMLVGRSRRADVVVDDEEVGREQFRLVLEGPALFIEGIGQTNRTTVDGAKLDAGQRAQLVAGAAIKVGRSTFLVQVGDATEGPPARPGAIDATLVAPRPSRPGDIPKPEEQTGGGSSPMGTMQMPRPGQGGNERATMPPKDGAADDAGMMTMPPKSYRPGQSPSAPPPASPPPAAPAASPAPPPPASNPPRSGAPKPTTVLVRVSELPPVAAQAGLSPAELEARLHQSLPRLVVKGEGLKRRIRLMKLRSRIGRAETADVLLPHETVSEQHAELQFDGAAWHLVDSGSANGTLVDGALLRAASQPIQRHTLLGFGNLRAVFLCNDAATAAEQRADERRAVQYLVKQGRLGRELAKQALQLVQKDQSQSLCEVLLMDTPIEAADWQLAIAATKGKLGFFARLLRLFSRRGGQNHSGGASGGGAGSGAGR
ncbi:MAG: FHA domain-containing protein [Planctomycetota bacterium]